MPPIQYNIKYLARKLLCMRAIDIHPDIINTIVGIYMVAMKRTHIDEIIDAQLILSRYNDFIIYVKDIDLFVEYEFYDLLKRAAHKNHCSNLSRLELGTFGDSFNIRVGPCDCNDTNIWDEYDNFSPDVDYEHAREFLRIVYNNSLKITLETNFRGAQIQIFERTQNTIPVLMKWI